MTSRQGASRRAACAAFLLFAAVLAGLSVEASAPKTVADVELKSASLALQLPAAEPSEPSRFGFSSSLELLDLEARPGRFGLFGPENERCERTYARNNPLRFVDPNGQDGVEAAAWLNAKAQALVDWGGTHDGAHQSSYVDIANTMSSVGDLISVGSSIGDAIGSGAGLHELGMAFSTDLGRAGGLALFMGTAADSIFSGGPAATRSPTVQENKTKGDAFRDKVANELRGQGREVATEVSKSTPFGKRVMDVEVRQNGKALGGIETKTGGSPYTPSQRAKDEYLRRVGYPVTVVRD